VRGLSRISAVFAGTTLLADWAGFRQRRNETPAEYAARLGDWMPEHRETIRSIAAAYAAERYRRRRGPDLPDDDALNDLRRFQIRRILTRPIRHLLKPRP
jgi:hypothetical protein